MGTLLELVFAEQSSQQAIGLLTDILAFAQGSLRVDVDGGLLSREVLPFRVVSDLKTRAVLNLAQFELPRVGKVRDVTVYLLRRIDVLDIELNIDLGDVDDHVQLTLGLYEFAATMAKKHSVKSYFAGLEPAWDEDTRIFTGRRWGPLRL